MATEREDEAISGEKLRGGSAEGAEAEAEAGAGAEGAREAGLWRACAAEGAGAALLVLLPCLSAARDPLHAALAAGATVAMLVQCFDHVSLAMFNPAVSLAGALLRRISWRRAAAYLPAQLAGALLGALALRALAGSEACSRCVTLPAGVGVGAGAAWRAAGVEAALSACLAWANCANWARARPAPPAACWPLRIGATVAALALAAGELTGASMNPARSLGPALLSSSLAHHWVYWAGPLGGAGAASLLYRALWAHCPPPPPAAPLPRARRPKHAAPRVGRHRRRYTTCTYANQ